jgi:hypothetical protein
MASGRKVKHFLDASVNKAATYCSSGTSPAGVFILCNCSFSSEMRTLISGMNSTSPSGSKMTP